MEKVLEITSNDHIIMIDKLCKRILGYVNEPKNEKYIQEARSIYSNPN